LRQALTVLSPRQAEIFVLRYLEGYENREIAEMLATSQAVVAVSLFRARAQLKTELRKLSGGMK
jgi:RNA polymerase sigma factor (sigma-70 family)